jgi:acyl carrier protein
MNLNEERAKKVIIDIMGLNEDQLMYSLVLVDDLIIEDESTILELITALEKEFNTKLSDKQAANLCTARRLINAFANWTE